MKVCDKHPNTPAIDTLQLIGEDTHIDLCENCRNQVYEFFKGKDFPSKPGLMEKVFGK